MINPENMSLKEWADCVILELPNAWAFGRIDDEANWREWATGFLRAGFYSARNLPNPYDFTDWRDWAFRVTPLLETVSA